VDDDLLRKLEHRLETSEDEDEQHRLRDAIAEQQGMALTGDAHSREGAAETS
jgi:hypothetical protein